jgi:hypothetical protein
VSRSTGWSTIALTAFVTACPFSANALQLDWQAPTGCPTAEAVRREIGRLAGSSESETLTARAVVTPTADARFQVTIDLAGSASGHRTLTGDSCRQIARASALIIALAANPEAALELHADDPDLDTKAPAPAPASPQSSSTSSPEPGESVPSPSTPKSQPQKRSSTEPTSGNQLANTPEPTQPDAAIRHAAPPPRWVLSALVGREWGTLPTPTNWLGVEGKLRSKTYPFSVALLTAITQRTQAEYVDIDIGAKFQAFLVQSRICVEPTKNGWFVEACGGAQLTLVRASAFTQPERLGSNGFAAVDAFTTYRWFAGPVMALALGYEVARAVSLKASAVLAVPAQRWQFVIDNVGKLYETAEVQKFLYVGAGACFE